MFGCGRMRKDVKRGKEKEGQGVDVLLIPDRILGTINQSPTQFIIRLHDQSLSLYILYLKKKEKKAKKVHTFLSSPFKKASNPI